MGKLQRVVVLGLMVGSACGGGHAASDAHVDDTAIAIDAAIDAPPDAAYLAADAGADMTLLSMQGVYGIFASRTIPTNAIAYDVNHELWVDGATKRRWLILPPGTTQIDNTDQEHWIFPVGTRLVKEFTRDSELVETRIVERLADSGGPVYSLRTFVWRADDSDADLTTTGSVNVRGTAHDAPTGAQCLTCHNGEAGKVLGFSAVQLSAAMLAHLSSTNRLSTPIPSGTLFGPTGATATVAALGYLHANCGHCHNPNGAAASANNMTLRLDAASKAADQEPGYLTTVNIAVQGNGLGATKRIEPQTPTNSAVLKRPSVRGASQMPPIATKAVDPTAVTTITDWINSL